MTEEGIVQQWLEQHYLEQLTADIVQELIEKIKQEFQPRSEDDYMMSYKMIRQKLIGDTQE